MLSLVRSQRSARASMCNRPNAEVLRVVLDAAEIELSDCFRVLAERCAEDGRESVVEEYRLWAMEQAPVRLTANAARRGMEISPDLHERVRSAARTVVQCVVESAAQRPAAHVARTAMLDFRDRILSAG